MSKHVLSSPHENESEVALVTLTERTVRGALKVTVDTSKSIVRAGEAFSVFVTIENPFDIPIIVQSTETHLPIELRDLFGEYLRRNATKGEREKQLAGLPLREWLKKRLNFLWADLSGCFLRISTPQIAQAYSTKESALVTPREFISQIISAHLFLSNENRAM